MSAGDSTGARLLFSWIAQRIEGKRTGAVGSEREKHCKVDQGLVAAVANGP
jgi:hypothetical protein